MKCARSAPSLLVILAICILVASANPAGAFVILGAPPLSPWPDAASAIATMAAMASTDAEAAAPPASADLLQFLDGTVLHGALKAWTPSRGLRWEHPDATSAV